MFFFGFFFGPFSLDHCGSVLRFTDSGYPFGIFKLLFNKKKWHLLVVFLYLLSVLYSKYNILDIGCRTCIQDFLHLKWDS